MFQERLKIYWKDYCEIQRVANQVRLTRLFWENKAKDALQTYFDEVEKHVTEHPDMWPPKENA